MKQFSSVGSQLVTGHFRVKAECRELCCPPPPKLGLQPLGRKANNLHWKLQNQILKCAADGEVSFVGSSQCSLFCKVKIWDGFTITSRPHSCNDFLRLTWLTQLCHRGGGGIYQCAEPPHLSPLLRGFEAGIHLRLFFLCPDSREPVIAPVSLPSGTQTKARDKLRQTHTFPLLLCVCVSVCVSFASC